MVHGGRLKAVGGGIAWGQDATSSSESRRKLGRKAANVGRLMCFMGRCGVDICCHCFLANPREVHP